jgi:DNA-binding PadR family transcriptional regulator
MEKKLLLLGLLRSQEMHGYQLNDHLAQGPGMAITLSKPNAYKLLKTMEADDWVTSHEEREGNRPIRRVYSVTPDGEAAFQQLLRESLVAYPISEFPSVVALNFLHELSPQEAVALLQQRRQKVEDHFHELDAVPEEIREHHLSHEYLYRHYTTELEWLAEIIERLSS